MIISCKRKDGLSVFILLEDSVFIIIQTLRNIPVTLSKDYIKIPEIRIEYKKYRIHILLIFQD